MLALLKIAAKDQHFAICCCAACRISLSIAALALASSGEMAEWLKAHAWKVCLG